MIENILDKLKAYSELLEETAFIVTFDEGRRLLGLRLHSAARLLRRRPPNPADCNLALLSRWQSRA